MSDVVRLYGSSDADRAIWLALLDEVGGEPFAHPTYTSLFADKGDSAVALVVHDSGSMWLVPFIERQLPPELGLGGQDLISPYGYGGPFLVTGDEGAVPPLHLVSEYLRDECYASAFMRLSLSEGESAASAAVVSALVRDVAPNVVLALGDTEDVRWRGYAHKVRKNVKKALRAGCIVTHGHDVDNWEALLGIYAHTMERRGAHVRYRFSPDFFEAFSKDLRDYCDVYVTWDAEGAAVSAELILTSSGHAYSFLGGTLARAFPVAPNDLLKHVAANDQALQGRRHFVLGGGHTPGDGIFRYKLSFAPEGEVTFRSANLVGDAALYEDLLRRAQRGPHSDSGFFPGYRFPDA